MLQETIVADPEMDGVIERLSREVKAAAASMNRQEARFLVDKYYEMQDNRKRSDNQDRAASMSAEPSVVSAWLARQNSSLETRIKSLLDSYSEAQPLGRKARAQVGIGPVIAAGLLAHIDIAKAPTAGHIWSFAGLDPRAVWIGTEEMTKRLVELFGERPKYVTREHVIRACNEFRRPLATIEGYLLDEPKKVGDDRREMDEDEDQEESRDKAPTLRKLAAAMARRPGNAKLKVLCWKIGESFVKVSGNPRAFYGLEYVKCKEDEVRRNANGDFAVLAEAGARRVGKTTESYKHYIAGKLPPAHLHARAKRRAVKLFLSHYHEVGYELLHGRKAPRPWSIEHGGHSHYIAPPPEWGA